MKRRRQPQDQRIRRVQHTQNTTPTTDSAKTKPSEPKMVPEPKQPAEIPVAKPASTLKQLASGAIGGIVASVVIGSALIGYQWWNSSGPITPDEIETPPPTITSSFLLDDSGNVVTDPAVTKPVTAAIEAAHGKMPQRFVYTGVPDKGKPVFRTLTIVNGIAPAPATPTTPSTPTTPTTPTTPATPSTPTTPAPVNPGELKVIIAYESSGNLTQGQVGVSTNPELRTFLIEKCTKDASGHPMFRIWDRDISATTDKSLDDVWAAVKPKLSTDPKVMELIIFQNGTAAIYPIKDAAEALELLKKVVK